MSPENQASKPSESRLAVSRDELMKITRDIIAHGVPVWRKNIDGVMVPIPVDKLERYIGENAGEITFYLDADWKDRIKKRQEGPVLRSGVAAVLKQLEQYGDVPQQADSYRKLSIVDREEILDSGIEKLNGLKETRTGLDLSVIVGMVEVVAYTFYTHHANLEDLTDSPNLRNNIQGIMAKSRWIISILIDLLHRGLNSYADYNIIEDLTVSSITIDHIIRTLLKYISFCIYYNNYIDQGLVGKNIRAVFREKYARYYKRRLDIDNLSLESIFKDGIRRIDEASELPDYAMGALLYDMGKLPDLTYHDSAEMNYDVKLVKKHALNSYNMILNSQSYPFVVPAMAAFHHEFYGNKDGYNFTDAILAKLYKTTRDESKTHYYITFSEKEFINGQALAYFPVKVLEVVDIFDAIKNKKKKSADEALTIMKKEFIAKSLKIDPVIFAIFLEFNLKCGLIDKSEFDTIDSMIV